MPHVVTQSCVGDGSCVYACPVNCIQPTPDDPAFELAEMLHVDPAACVDCGACVAACPVDAIKPHWQLSEEERAFEVINAAYHQVRRPRALLAPVRPALTFRDRGEPLRVAIVGSGPAAMYAAEEVLTIPGARVSIFERLPTPYGLVQTGVAPDHRRTRRVSRQFEAIRNRAELTLHTNTEVGRDVSHEQLLETHHAVIYAVGATADRRLEVPGADLPGVLSAGELVGWYNGHPDHRDRTVDLSHRRAVVIGNGNVALDIARILTVDPATLVDSQIAPAALAALRTSQLEEVVVIGRRGPQHSAFTLPELVGLSATPGITLSVAGEDLAGLGGSDDPKLELLAALQPPAGSGRRVTLRYHLTPTAVHGAQAVEAVELVRSGTGDAGAAPTRIEAGLVISSIGYRGLPVGGLPFDEASGTIPNDGGRVIDPASGTATPGTYVVGWIKRGPSGFIGTNKACSQDTVAALVDDHNAGRLAPLAAGASVRATPTVAARPRYRRLRAAS